MKYFSIVTVVFFFFRAVSFAQDSKQLDSWLDDHAREMGGRSILVVWKDGKVVYEHAAADMSTKQKMVNRYVARKLKTSIDGGAYTVNSRQPIASCSKWLSAALVMSFVDEGKLRLEDTVGAFLPVLSAHGKGGITIAECLSHTTGIKSPDLREDLKRFRDFRSMDDAVGYISEMRMEGAPGTVFRYSNAGLQLAGAVLEKIGGKGFGELFADRIAGPLGMTNTDFGKGAVALPAGGAGSTPEDYLHFLIMIRNKGEYNGRRVLSEAAVAAMQVDRLGDEVKIAYTPVPTDRIGYGFGEWVVRPGGETVTSPGLFGSIPWVDKKKDYCAFLMTFNIRHEDRGSQFRDLKKMVDSLIP